MLSGTSSDATHRQRKERRGFPRNSPFKKKLAKEQEGLNGAKGRKGGDKRWWAKDKFREGKSYQKKKSEGPRGMQRMISPICNLQATPGPSEIMRAMAKGAAGHRCHAILERFAKGEKIAP